MLETQVRQLMIPHTSNHNYGPASLKMCETTAWRGKQDVKPCQGLCRKMLFDESFLCAEGLSFLNNAKTGLSFEDLGTGCSNLTTAGDRVSYLQPVNGAVSDPWSYYARALTFQACFVLKLIILCFMCM